MNTIVKFKANIAEETHYITRYLLTGALVISGLFLPLSTVYAIVY